MQSYYYAQKRTAEIKKRIETIISLTKKLPSGHLNTSDSNGKIQNYQIIGNRGEAGYQRVYLGKNKSDIIEGLALKEYYKAEYYDLLKELELLKPLLACDDSHISKLIDKRNEYNQLFLTRVQSNFNAHQWMHADFPSSAPFKEKHTRKAIDGTWVRSKIEADYIQLLCYKKIPYRYECDLIIDGEFIGCPDFTLISPSKN